MTVELEKDLIVLESAMRIFSRHVTEDAAAIAHYALQHLRTALVSQPKEYRAAIDARDAYIKFLMRNGIQGNAKSIFTEGMKLSAAIEAADAALPQPPSSGVVG